MAFLNFRYASTGDLSTLREIDRDISDVDLKFKVTQKQIILAELNSEIVGYLRLDPIWTKIPYIGLIWVVRHLRGQRIGTKLLAWLEQELLSNGHTFLLSSSQANEVEPQQWHRSVGFSDCGTLHEINGPGVGELFFGKVLK